MSEFILFATLRGIGFTGKACKSLVVDVDSPWINACNQHIYSQIKLQAIDKEWICYVPTHNASFVYRDFRNVIYL